MVIATFAPTTGWSGRTITFDNEVFTLQDHGPISAADVLSYASQGHLVWANDEMRAWVESKVSAQQAARGTTSVIATFAPTTGWSGRTITFDNEVFTLQDYGPLSASDVLTYDSQGHLLWANDQMRAWVESRAAVPHAANDAAASADIASTLASGWAKVAASAGVASVAVGKAAESTRASFSEGRAAAQSSADSAPSSPEASTSAVEPLLAAEPLPVVEEPVLPAPNAETAAIPVDAPVTSIADEIAKLAELHAKGVLTDEEFAASKAKLVG